MPEWSGEFFGHPFILSGEDVFRIAVAVLLGGVIGFEREMRDKPAGLRTMILICVGAASFTVMSLRMGGPEFQTTRIAAQIVSGVGFLGAGVIFREQNFVFGLTTAATIWIAAAVGMTVGFGYVVFAGLTTVAVLAALSVFSRIELFIDRRRAIERYRLAVRKSDEVAATVAGLFESARLRVVSRIFYEQGADVVFEVRAIGATGDHEQFRMDLIRSDRVTLLPP